MKLLVFVNIYSKDEYGALETFSYPINKIEDVLAVKIPQNATGFAISYRMEENISAYNKIHTLSFAQNLGFQNFAVNVAQEVKYNQIISAVKQFKAPVFKRLDGKKGQVKTRLVERHFESCHPELDRFEERPIPDKNHFLLPKNYEKAQLIKEYVYPLIVNGKPQLMRSQPIAKQTYYVGTIESVDNGLVSFTTIKGGMGFANPEDIIISPSDIDEFGRVNDAGKKL